MKRPAVPPVLDVSDLSRERLSRILSPENSDYARKFNGSYIHWDKLRYENVGDSDPSDIWFLMKITRNSNARYFDFDELRVHYNLPDLFQKLLHDIDTYSNLGPFPPENFREKERLIYSISSMMEESIASSQIEGAVTTTKAAKTMLRNNRHPKDKSEQMIVNNYNAMKFIKDEAGRELTPDLICEIHSIVSAETMDEKNIGRFRDTDDIVIKDIVTDEIFHQPVGYGRIGALIRSLCDFANSDEPYIHPIVKGIIIHFIFAYIHPFSDGNGRVSRSLFYWYAMKNGYWLMEYLSISKSIKNHSDGYYRAFLLTETDNNDMTYFIEYNLDIIVESIDTFKKYLEKKMNEQKNDLKRIGRNDLNIRQKLILSDMIRSDDRISIASLRNTYHISINTARSDISKLKEAGLIRESSRDGNRILYCHSTDKDV